MKIVTTKALAVILLMAVCQVAAFSQKLSARIGDKYFSEFGYIKAIEYYQFAYEKDTTDIYLVKQLAEANRLTGNTRQTERWLKKIIDRGEQQPEDLFNYAQCLKSNSKYLMAAHFLKQYALLRPQDDRVLIPPNMLQYIELLRSDSTKSSILNVSLNTQGSEMGPAFLNDQLIFSSTSLQKHQGARYGWNDLPFLHLYAAAIDSVTGDLTAPQPFAVGLMTAYHDGPVCFDVKKGIIYFTRNNIVKRHASKSKKGVVNLKIFMGKAVGDKWELTGAFPYNSDEYSVGHPSIDSTGKVLYFASDMPGGYGESDIYSSTLINDQWTKPFNLGPGINTAGNEFFPFISQKGSLYFASEGHGGLGGLDIYASVPDSGYFKTTSNLGYMVNSPKDDFGLALDAKDTKGYFSSNRKGGKGDDDLYSVNMNRIRTVIIRGTVRDLITNDLLSDAEVTLLDATGKPMVTCLTNIDGYYGFEVPKGKRYQLNASKELYIGQHIEEGPLALPVIEDLVIELFLDRSQKVKPVVMLPVIAEVKVLPVKNPEFETINYDFNKSTIRKDAALKLDKMVATMNEFPAIKIRIESHTDSRGNDQYNLSLSQKRAKSANNYLVSRGINPKRLFQKGYGETQLLNKCSNVTLCTEAEHQVNRRSTMAVVGKK